MCYIKQLQMTEGRLKQQNNVSNCRPLGIVEHLWQTYHTTEDTVSVKFSFQI